MANGDDYNTMMANAPQGGNPNYWQLPGMGQGGGPGGAGRGPQLPGMGQGGGAQQYGAQGMPSNGMGGQQPPGAPQRFAQNMMAMRGASQPGQSQQQGGGGNPFLAAVARWHQAQQQAGQQPGAMGRPPMPGGQMGAPQGPGGVPQPQWGPNPMPQGMRGPATMGGVPGQPPWAGQNVQWGPPVSGQQGGGGNGS